MHVQKSVDKTFDAICRHSTRKKQFNHFKQSMLAKWIAIINNMLLLYVRASAPLQKQFVYTYAILE